MTNLLSQVADRIDRNPDAYNQGVWGADASDLDKQVATVSGLFDLVSQKQGVSCGTVCCAAGHIVLEAANSGLYVNENADIAPEAARLVGLESSFSSWLFSEDRSETHMSTILRFVAGGGTYSQAMELEHSLIDAAEASRLREESEYWKAQCNEARSSLARNVSAFGAFRNKLRDIALNA